MGNIVVFITASSEGEADRISNALIDSKTAACVNIVPNIKSVFMWEGKKDTADEYLLIAKTNEDRFDELKQKVKELHSYGTPEIIGLPVKVGEENYLNWVQEALR